VDVNEFYSDSRRGRSPQVQFGGAWLDGAGYSYFVVWVERTGELYAIREVLRGEAPLLPIIALANPWVLALPRRVDVEAEIFVLLTEASRPRIDSLLDGWADLQGQPGGFEELVGRLDKAGYPPPW
jgi:hypothetical protein